MENDGVTNISEEERKIFTLLRDLVLEADPEGDDKQAISTRFLFVKAYQFNGVNVWGGLVIVYFAAKMLVTTTLSRIVRGVAERLAAGN